MSEDEFLLYHEETFMEVRNAISACGDKYATDTETMIKKFDEHFSSWGSKMVGEYEALRTQWEKRAILQHERLSKMLTALDGIIEQYSESAAFMNKTWS